MNIKFCLARDVPRLSATNGRAAERSTEAECECMKPFLCRALVVQLETLSVLLPWTALAQEHQVIDDPCYTIWRLLFTATQYLLCLELSSR